MKVHLTYRRARSMGTVAIGDAPRPPIVGERFRVNSTDGGFLTTRVIAVLPNGEFRTADADYCVTLLPPDRDRLERIARRRSRA